MHLCRLPRDVFTIIVCGEVEAGGGRSERGGRSSASSAEGACSGGRWKGRVVQGGRAVGIGPLIRDVMERRESGMSGIGRVGEGEGATGGTLSLKGD